VRGRKMPLVNLKDVFIATRPWSFPASLVGIVLGSAAAWTTGTFSLHKFLVTLIGGIIFFFFRCANYAVILRYAQDFQSTRQVLLSLLITLLTA
jgi:hypothetical protein